MKRKKTADKHFQYVYNLIRCKVFIQNIPARQSTQRNNSPHIIRRTVGSDGDHELKRVQHKKLRRRRMMDQNYSIRHTQIYGINKAEHTANYSNNSLATDTASHVYDFAAAHSSNNRYRYTHAVAVVPAIVEFLSSLLVLLVHRRCRRH